MQAALNAALSDLPGDMPTLPTFRKANPAAAPILILALTSKTMPASAIYDAADSVIAQRLSQVDGVADVTVAGAEQPAIRVRVDPARLAAMGLSLEDVRTAIANANARRPARHLRRRQARDHASASTISCATPTTTIRVVVKTVERHRRSGCPTSPSIAAERAQQPLGRLVQHAARRCC